MIIVALIILPLTYITIVLNIYNKYVNMAIDVIAVLIALYVAQKIVG